MFRAERFVDANLYVYLYTYSRSKPSNVNELLMMGRLLRACSVLEQVDHPVGGASH